MTKDQNTKQTNNSILPEVIVALPSQNGYELVFERTILYCKAAGNYTYIHLSDGRIILISKKLKDLSKCLEGAWFLRIHQSYLANIKHVSQYLRRKGGLLVMNDKSILPISRTKKEEVLSLFKIVR